MYKLTDRKVTLRVSDSGTGREIHTYVCVCEIRKPSVARFLD